MNRLNQHIGHHLKVKLNMLSISHIQKPEPRVKEIEEDRIMLRPIGPGMQTLEPESAHTGTLGRPTTPGFPTAPGKLSPRLPLVCVNKKLSHPRHTSHYFHTQTLFCLSYFNNPDHKLHEIIK